MTHITPMKKAGLALAALVLFAVPMAAALPMLSLKQEAQTPVGNAYVSTDEPTCVDLQTPALPPLPAVPAVPSLPVPLPIAPPSIPALPPVEGGAEACIEAGTDGVYANATANAAGIEAGAEADAGVPYEVQKTADESKGFFEGLVDTIQGWF